MTQTTIQPFAFDPGSLRHRIALYEPTFDIAQPWLGSAASTLVAEIWAGLLEIASQERVEAEQGANSRQISFVIRHRADLGQVSQLVFNGERFDLLSLRDPDMTGRWLILQTRSSLGDE